MPQARSGGSRRSGSDARASSSGAKRSTRSSSGGSSTKRSGSGSRGSSSSRSSSSARTSSSGTRARSTSSQGRSTSAGRSRSTQAASGADARFEEVANRIRKLNERIIDASKEAGETTLSSYERALKSIASAIQRGPGSSEIEWVSNVATAQAKFIRDLTTAWTSAARKMLK
jgi:hypothetical protein